MESSGTKGQESRDKMLATKDQDNLKSGRPILITSKDQLLQNEPGQPGWKILKEEMVKQLPKRDVFSMVLVSVAKAFADLNVKEISEADRDYLVNELTDNIIKLYPSIRLNEIPEAIACGVRGRYGEYFGLSVITFERFIERYLLSEKRTGLVKQLPPADNGTQHAPGLETQFDTAKYNALLTLQKKKDHKDISPAASSVYAFLDQLGLVTFSIPEKQDMLADAVRELIADLKLKLYLANYTERTAIKKEIAVYTSAITEHTPVDDRLLNLAKMRARKLALDAFLNQVIMDEIDLSGLIESKRGLFLERSINEGFH